MSVRDLIPWGRSNNRAPVPYRDDDRNPFLSLHREMNRVFDDFFRDYDMRLPTMGGTGGRPANGTAKKFAAES